MWRDLEEGVLELFVEARSTYSEFHRTVSADTHGDGAHDSACRLRTDNRLARNFQAKEIDRRTRTDIRAIRAAQPKVAIVTCAVEIAVCPRCGGRVERREGMTRWQHVGTMRGVCHGGATSPPLFEPEPVTETARGLVATARCSACGFAGHRKNQCNLRIAG